MKTSDLFKKENIYGALAVALVLVFVFSSFAASWLGSGGTQNTGNNATAGYYETEVVVNATLSAYQPYIIADVTNATVADSLKSIPGVDDVMSTSQGYVVSLRSGSNVTGVYLQLLARNITGKANALIMLPSVIRISNATFSENVSGNQVSAKLEPIFDEGENLSVRVLVGVQDRQVVAYGQLTVLPSLRDFSRNATVIALTATKTGIYVPWELRAEINDTLANLTEKYGAGNVTYTRKDFIIGNAGNSTPSYVTFVAGDTIYVGNFTDRSRAEADFANATFPESVLVINGEANESWNFTVSHAYLYNVRIDDESGAAFVALQSMNVYAQNDTVGVIVSAYAIKDRISSITGAREA